MNIRLLYIDTLYRPIPVMNVFFTNFNFVTFLQALLTGLLTFTRAFIFNSLMWERRSIIYNLWKCRPYHHHLIALLISSIVVMITIDNNEFSWILLSHLIFFNFIEFYNRAYFMRRYHSLYSKINTSTSMMNSWNLKLFWYFERRKEKSYQTYSLGL